MYTDGYFLLHDFRKNFNMQYFTQNCPQMLFIVQALITCDSVTGFSTLSIVANTVRARLALVLSCRTPKYCKKTLNGALAVGGGNTCMI